MNGKKVQKKQPPKLPTRSIQFDLFSQFVTNDEREVSNAIELWDSIPKYFLTPHQVSKLRTPTGHADPYKWEFSHNGKPCAVKIQPALIEQVNGSYKAFFPGVTEELVEEALKKILADSQCGFHDADNSETWVSFTLRMVDKELKSRKRTRSITEIRHAIEVMNKCNIAYYINGNEAWSGAILQDLVTVGRDEFLANQDARHVARLPVFISKSINQLGGRQFNLDRYLACGEQLTRWIYKQLINRFKQASQMNSYHFMYSDIKESGLLQQTREIDNRRKVISSLDELVAEEVLSSYTSDIRKNGRRIVDVKFTVFASNEFVKEQKAANKRSKDAVAVTYTNKKSF